MEYSAADKRRVFLAYRALFVREHALLRRSKPIRELVQKHRFSFEPLLGDFGLEEVVSILKDLLAKKTFQSELRAQVVFPELFQTSPARDAQRTTSEDDAARSEAEALEVASLEGDNHGFGDEADVEGVGATTVDDEPRAGFTEPTMLAVDNIPSLYPVYLPYKIQHLILMRTQSLLEECCFDFATRWLPRMFEEKDWNCPEAVELTKWTKILAQRCEKLPQHALDLDEGMSLKEVLYSTHGLRHTAVHRLSTCAPSISQMVKSALKLAKTLCDPLRAARLEELHQEIEARIKDMELNKNFLEDKLGRDLCDIRRQREELDRKEKDVIATMLREDQEMKALVGSLLQSSVVDILRDGVTPEQRRDGAGRENGRAKEAEEEQEDDIPELWYSPNQAITEGFDASISSAL